MVLALQGTNVGTTDDSVGGDLEQLWKTLLSLTCLCMAWTL